MSSYTLIILCAIAAVHGYNMKKVDTSECRDDDSTYTLTTRHSFDDVDDRIDTTTHFLKPKSTYRALVYQPVVSGHREPECQGVDITIVPSTGFECIQRLLCECNRAYIDELPDILVKGAVTSQVKRIQSTPYQKIKSESVYVINQSDLEQEGHTSKLTLQMTEAFEFSMGQKIGIKASAKFGIPLIGETKIEVSGEFNFGEKWTSTKSKSIEFTSQTVKVPPRSRIRLYFDVHLAKFEGTYLGNFTLDTYPRYAHNCFKAVQEGRVTLNLEKPGMVGEVTAIYTKDEQRLNNVPMTFVSDGFETKIIVMNAEPLAEAATISDPAIPEVNILDLQSFNNIFN